MLLNLYKIILQLSQTTSYSVFHICVGREVRYFVQKDHMTVARVQTNIVLSSYMVLVCLSPRARARVHARVDLRVCWGVFTLYAFIC